MDSNINPGRFYNNLQEYSSTPCISYASNRFISAILIILLRGLEVVLERGEFGHLRREGHVKRVRFT
jgi:hypothetical protein